MIRRDDTKEPPPHEIMVMRRRTSLLTEVGQSQNEAGDEVEDDDAVLTNVRDCRNPDLHDAAFFASPPQVMHKYP